MDSGYEKWKINQFFFIIYLFFKKKFLIDLAFVASNSIKNFLELKEHLIMKIGQLVKFIGHLHHTETNINYHDFLKVVKGV